MDLGPGLIIIICLWLSALIICGISSSEPGRCPFLAAAYAVAVTVITLILIFLPRAPIDAPEISKEEEQVHIQDEYIIYRLLLCAFIGVSFIVGIILTLTGDLAEQVQARPLNKMKI